MNTYFVIFSRNKIFNYYQNYILLLLKNSKVLIHIIHITNYILNGMLSNFIVNKKVEHKMQD
jgi:hypothetical protein